VVFIFASTHFRSWSNQKCSENCSSCMLTV